MPDRLRKLIGSIVLVIFVVIYALIVMTIAAKLPGASGLAQLAFYLVTGLAWVVPAAALIYWMQKPRRRT